MRSVLIVLLLIACCASNARECTHTNLSRKYNYTVSARWIKDTAGDERIAHLSVTVSAKQQPGTTQHIDLDLSESFFFSAAFADCNAVRSYSTGLNAKAETVDFEYGDLIVADFNFDGFEDFAVKTDSGGNAGPYYQFYISDREGRFRKDAYLSKEIGVFPDIVTAKKQLVVVRSVGCCKVVKRTYQFNPRLHSWRLIATKTLQ